MAALGVKSKENLYLVVVGGTVDYTANFDLTPDSKFRRKDGLCRKPKPEVRILFYKFRLPHRFTNPRHRLAKTCFLFLSRCIRLTQRFLLDMLYILAFKHLYVKCFSKFCIKMRGISKETPRKRIP